MTKARQAREFAYIAHAGQFRDGGAPYIVHPAQVARIISQVTRDEDLIAAAWLHDVIEDTEYTYDDIRERFGQRVADLVMEVTHEVSPKGAYFPRLETRDGILLKFADRLSNLSDMQAWDDKRQASYLKKSKFWKSEETQ